MQLNFNVPLLNLDGQPFPNVSLSKIVGNYLYTNPVPEMLPLRALEISQAIFKGESVEVDEKELQVISDLLLKGKASHQFAPIVIQTLKECLEGKEINAVSDSSEKAVESGLDKNDLPENPLELKKKEVKDNKKQPIKIVKNTNAGQFNGSPPVDKKHCRTGAEVESNFI